MQDRMNGREAIEDGNSENSKTVLLFSCVSAFLVMLDASILYVAFPAIKATYANVSSAHLSWILNAYTIMLGAFLIPAGSYADRIGRRRLLEYGLVIFTIGSFLCGISQNVLFLILARALQGVGSAFLLPTSLAFVLAEFSGENRGFAISVWGSVGAFSGAIGPSLGAVIINVESWRWIFFVNVPIGIWALFQGRRRLREARLDPIARLPNFFGTILSIISIGLISLAVVQSKEWGWSYPGTSYALMGGLLILIFFLFQNGRSHSPVMDMTLFRSRHFSTANAALFLFSVIIAGLFLGSVLFLRDAWQYSTLQTGLAMSLFPIGSIPVALTTGKTAIKRGNTIPLIFGGFLLGICFVILAALATPVPRFLALWFPFAILVGIAGGLIAPSLTTAATLNLPASQYAMGSGMTNSFRQFGSVLGVALAVAFVGNDASVRFSDFGTLFWCLSACGFVVGTLCFFVHVKSYGSEGLVQR